SFREPELRAERLARGYQSVERGPLARCGIGENPRGSEVRAVRARHPQGYKSQLIRQIAIERECLRLDRLQIYLWMLWDVAPRNRSVKLLHLGQRGIRIHVARNHENCVVGSVPILVELLEHRAGGAFKRRPRAQRIVRVWRAGKEIFVKA